MNNRKFNNRTSTTNTSTGFRRREPSVALMCKSHDFDYQASTDTFVTGDWVISPTRQQELVGEKVVLTESQRGEAYMGGTIVGFVPSEKKSKQTQVKVVFKADPSLVGDDTSVCHYNWGYGRSVCYLD